MMPDPEVTLTADLRGDERAVVLNGLVAYNAEHGYPWPWVDLDFALRDSAGRVIGGIIAETNARWCFIKGLWVNAAYRRRGHGRQLLNAVEEAARARDCIGVYLDTYSFQARPFYEQAGYTVFGVLPDLPLGGAKYYLAKRIDTPAPPAG